MSGPKKTKPITKAQGPLKIGSHWAAKFHVKTSNGDVVIAKLTEDHPAGRPPMVVLHDLLTGKERRKQRADLLTRNHVVTKDEAARIVETFKTKGRAAARELAVTIGRDRGRDL